MAFLFGVTGPSIWYQCFWSLMQGRMFLEKVFHAITLLKRLWDSEKSEWTPTSFQHFWTNVQYVQFSAARQQRWLSIPRILKKAMQQRLEFMQIQWTFCVALLRVKETGKKIIPRPVGCPVAVCPPSHVRSSIVMGPRLPYFEFHNSWSRGSKGQGQPSSISANDDPFFSFWMKWNQRWTFDDHWCWHFYSPHVDENWDVFYFTPGGPTCNTNTTVFFIAVLFSFWSSDCWIVGPDAPLSRWSRSRCERAAGEGPGEEVDLGDH